MRHSPQEISTREIRKILLKRLWQRPLTAAEQAMLDKWAGAAPQNRAVLDRLRDERSLTGELAMYGKIREKDLQQRLEEMLQKEQRGSRQKGKTVQIRWWRYAAAAAVLLALAAWAWFYTPIFRAGESGLAEQQHTIPDLPPGREGAILTLGDGRQILLDSLTDGEIALQDGARILLADGALRYQENGGSEAAPAMNTMTTPRGRQFTLVLPDGSRVWLNASTAITFPTVFSGNRREVQLKGEAYFEVRSIRDKPFHVHVDDRAEVEVLGTHFNVNGYPDERMIRTTLLEGSVRCKPIGGQDAAERAVVLRPGEQAQVAGDEDQIRIVRPDVDKVMAWKNGFFNFEDAGLEEVMRQIARWYDIEVAYAGKVPEIYFVGEMSRNLSLSGLLKGLEGAGVRFRMEDRRLIVLP